MHLFARLLSASTLALSLLGAAYGKDSVQVLGVRIADPMPIVKASLDTRTIPYQDAGVNKYTSGPMLDASGTGFGVEGLKTVRFIFNPWHRLAGAVLTLDKSRYSDVVGVLKGKYRLLQEETAFVGNQSAQFEAPDGTRIIAEAPHLSFDMSVIYATQDTLQKQLERDRADAEAQERHEAEQF